jgi:hypothetical protein
VQVKLFQPLIEKVKERLSQIELEDYTCFRREMQEVVSQMEFDKNIDAATFFSDHTRTIRALFKLVVRGGPSLPSLDFQHTMHERRVS